MFIKLGNFQKLSFSEKLLNKTLLKKGTEELKLQTAAQKLNLKVLHKRLQIQ
jgi:hypothetical protein